MTLLLCVFARHYVVCMLKPVAAAADDVVNAWQDPFAGARTHSQPPTCSGDVELCIRSEAQPLK